MAPTHFINDDWIEINKFLIISKEETRFFYPCFFFFYCFALRFGQSPNPPSIIGTRL